MKINQIWGKNMLLILSSPQQNQKVNQGNAVPPAYGNAVPPADGNAVPLV